MVKNGKIHLGRLWLWCLLGIAIGSVIPSTPAANLPPGFMETVIPDTWDDFAGVTFDEVGAVYAWDRKGRLWLIENDRRVPTPVLDISEEVGSWNDHGMLGVAFHPNFRQNGHIYVLYVVDAHHLFHFGTPDYSATSNDFRSATIGRITRYTARVSDNFRTVDPASRLVLLGDSPTNGIPITYITHGIGSLVFGSDGTLLASCGDGASLSDRGDDDSSYAAQALNKGILRPKENVGAFRSQMVDSFNGKILRMDPETGEGLSSNPFYDPAAPRSARSLVYALGFRNPFRFSRRPGTGSALPGAGQPGVLYIGEVGYFTWEEMDVCTGPGLNFGWPLFEGYSMPSSYAGANPTNQDAANPLFGTGGCAQKFFTFRDLLKEVSLDAPSWPNPCNTNEAVPGSVPHFVHTRPVADWMHNNGPSRVGVFNGNVASTVNIGSPSSPVSGPQFGGSCSIGGAWYTSTAFPPSFRNTYFHGDLAGGWIKSFTFDEANRLVSVQDFAQNAGAVVGMAVHPTNGALYYLSWTDTLRKITYAGPNNMPPTAVATADRHYGPGPLTVQFNGSSSSDPEGQTLLYDWNFGDGSPHGTQPNPVHSFASSGGPRRYDVLLTVTDSIGETNAAALSISVDNTPPVVAILTPTNGTLYSIVSQTVVNLSAEVTDAEHGREQLRPEWRVVLHHNEHIHSDPVDTNWTTTATLATLGCDGDTYFYRITLVVTDADGLTNAASVELYPNCNLPPHVAFAATNVTYTENGGPMLLDAAATFGDPDSLELGGGGLTVSFAANGAEEDRLDVRHDGLAAGHIGRSADVVLYGGVAFGTLTGGSSGAPLMIVFNSAATPEAVQALLRNVTYENLQDVPSILPRTLRVIANDGDGGVSAPVTLAIAIIAVPDEPVVTWANPAPINYGTALSELQLNATANIPGTFVYAPPGGIVPGAGEGMVLAVKFTPNDTLNYNEHMSSVLLDVARAPLVIRAEDKTTPHGSLPVLTADYAGFTNGDTVAALSAPVELSTIAMSNSPAGTYPILVSGGSSANYSITRISGTLTVLAPVNPTVSWPTGEVYYVRDSGPMVLSTNALVSDSDTIQFGGGRLTLAVTTNGAPPDKLAIQPDGGAPGQVGLVGEEVHYGGDAVGTWSGGADGSTPLLISLNGAATLEAVQAILRRVSFESSDEAESPPRTVRAVLEDGHGGVSAPAELTIIIIAPPVAPELVWAAPEPIVYGTPLAGGQLNASAGVLGTFSYEPPAGTLLLSGTAHPLSVHFVPQDAARYLPATAMVEIDVFRAPLVIRAESKSKQYGEPFPAFTFAFTGLVNGDTPESLVTPPAATAPESAAMHAGVYPIVPEGAASPNYAISYENGELTVLPAPLTIRADDKFKGYLETLPSLTASYSGLVNGDTPAVLDTPPVLATSAEASSPAGLYSITVGGALDGDYQISFVNGTLTVTNAAEGSLKLLILEVTSVGDVILQIAGPAGAALELEESFDLHVWSAAGQFSLTEPPMVHRDNGGGLGPQKFYRVKIRQ